MPPVSEIKPLMDERLMQVFYKACRAVPSKSKSPSLTEKTFTAR